MYTKYGFTPEVGLYRNVRISGLEAHIENVVYADGYRHHRIIAHLHFNEGNAKGLYNYSLNCYYPRSIKETNETISSMGLDYPIDIYISSDEKARQIKLVVDKFNSTIAKRFRYTVAVTEEAHGFRKLKFTDSVKDQQTLKVYSTQDESAEEITTVEVVGDDV